MLSIIIPAYNEEKYIEKCLASVFRQSDAPDCEVIVVDNASCDRTSEVVRDEFPQVKLVQEPKKGVTIARNRGAKEARGEILLFLDADVVVPQGYFKRVLAKFQRDKNLVLVSGPYSYTLDSNLCIKFTLSFVYRFLASPAECLFNRFLNLASSMNAGNFAVIKKYFEGVGGFDERISFFGDEADLARRLRGTGRVRFFLDLTVESSARRFRKEGVLKLCLKYALNVIWPVLFKRPFDRDYIDVR